MEYHNKGKNKLLSAYLFPVVGVGASAGGLDAFKRLIKAIPEHSGMAYILVQHLEPTHESLLADLLQRITPIPVHEITDNVHVEPNHIYIIPSNKLLTANDGRLQLNSRPPRNEKNMPIDVFFTSLAEVHGEHAIGVVLSGTATDGTLGLKAIKAHGGITIAQAQQTAAFIGMPQSAIDAEVADFVLAPEEIPLHLAKLTTTSDRSPGTGQATIESENENGYRQIISLLRARKGIDFSHYKQATIKRRIIRRMGLNKIPDLAGYLSWLKDNLPEQDLLYQDLLIPVTSFFRDPKIFDFLCTTVLPKLLVNKDNATPVRIWVAGCSTGQEPYSMAICLHEFLGDNADTSGLQIFASDISEKGIVKARSGVYSKKEVAGLSTARLQKYFTEIDGSFHILKIIRDMCVFANHNFLKDPPFSKMSFVSCRNVLIYMDASLQRRALMNFHYALNENGFLLLGRSETTAPAPDLFLSVGKNEKIFSRKSVAGRIPQQTEGHNKKRPDSKDGHSVKKEPGREDFQKSADHMLLTRYAPSGVVVNEELDIVQFRGSTGTWLEAPPGKPNLNVMKMARKDLAFELRRALQKAKTNNKALIRENIIIRPIGKQKKVTIEVITLTNTIEPHYLILFTENNSHPGNGAGAGSNISTGAMESPEKAESARNHQLEMELTQAREDMRVITEEQQGDNEMLQIANEELLSGSEELQSLNEELETSKEEIQSTNEELTTLNLDLFDRNAQLKQFSAELEQRVEDRTLSLKVANTSLKHSNESLEQFATIASHDLQEPLRKIRTFATLLNQRHTQDIAGPAKVLIDKINLSAERMSALIHDVLNFSKIIDASFFERTDLNDILQNVIADFDLLISQKGAVIDHDPLPTITAIPLQMNQLFNNLLGNALKFSKPGLPPAITITCRVLPAAKIKAHPSLDPKGPYYEIIFADNGIGINPQYSDQIFLIFQRLNTREHFEGTGIGLALCKRIVMNHRGEIYVYSQESRGSEFHVILPGELQLIVHNKP
jgi:two-component system CheB/CheR fusion protein